MKAILHSWHPVINGKNGPWVKKEFDSVTEAARMAHVLENTNQYGHVALTFIEVPAFDGDASIPYYKRQNVDGVMLYSDDLGRPNCYKI